MRKTHCILVLTILFSLTIKVIAQEKVPFVIYNKSGQKTSYSEMIQTLTQTNVVLFGEMHNNPICHWLQYEVTNDLNKIKDKKLILGAEMFETDNQLVINEYLSGDLPEKNLKDEMKLWSNFNTDYKPLLDFAKTNNLNFIATNIPRRYANYVARKGIDSLAKLSEEQKKLIAPLPIEIDMNLPGYKMFLEMGMGHGSEITPEKMAEAQAVKDATMAYNIQKNLPKNSIFIHYNGTYHSDNFEGICWYLKQYNKNLSFKTIASVEQENISELDVENKNKADFTIVIVETMTKTY